MFSMFCVLVVCVGVGCGCYCGVCVVLGIV